MLESLFFILLLFLLRLFWPHYTLTALRASPTPCAMGNSVAAFAARFSWEALHQGVTKRCRLSWLTNNALVYMSPYMRGDGGGGAVGSQPMSTAVHMEPK
jgi:hypothetical protein